MEKFIDFLHNTPSISNEFKSDFLNSGKKLLMKKKEYFIRQSEFCKYIGVIVSGDFLISHVSSEGMEYILGSSDNHDLMTDYSAFVNKTDASLNIQARTDAELLIYTRDQFDVFLEYNIDTQRYGRQAAEILMTNWQHALISFYCETPQQRYLKLFGQHPDLFQRIPLKHIASIIGVTPETVSRLRKKL